MRQKKKKKCCEICGETPRSGEYYLWKNKRMCGKCFDSESSTDDEGVNENAFGCTDDDVHWY